MADKLSAVIKDAKISCSPISEYAIRVIMEAHSYALAMLVTIRSVMTSYYGFKLGNQRFLIVC
jgi:hypothetical protein